MHIRPFEETDRTTVIQLWQDCGLTVSHNNPNLDIDRKLKVDPDLFMVGEENGQIIASVMAGYEGHRGWLNYLAVSPSHRRKGYARELVAAVEHLLLQKGAPKINLQIRSTNHEVIEFYKNIGYSPEEVVSMGKRLIHD